MEFHILHALLELYRLPSYRDENNLNTEIIEIFTDGACLGNPGPGGWGALLRWKGQEKEISGGEDLTTNNRMELQATIEALHAIKRSVPIHIYTDSKYVKDGITSWMSNWKKNNWRTANKKPVKNHLKMAPEGLGRQF